MRDALQRMQIERRITWILLAIAVAIAAAVQAADRYIVPAPYDEPTRADMRDDR